MKTTYIEAIQSGDEILNEPFLLQDVTQRTTKDGRPFLLYKARDKTGQISGVFWNVPEYIQAWAQNGEVILITGQIVTYKDALQINTTDINPCPDPDIRDFLPTSSRPRKEMVAELKDWIASLNAPWQDLVRHLLLEDDSFTTQFANAPAARTMHHAYIGGLLEHTLSMAALADVVAEHYDYVDRDLLITGALLHDMGKAIEYTFDGSFAFSEDGRLVGHILRAVVIIEKAAAAIDFPGDKLRQLTHLVASHHGKLEWGSPITPKTIEAVLLHQLDLLDSRVQGFFDYLEHDNGNDPWTQGNSKMFGTELKRPPGFSEDDNIS